MPAPRVIPPRPGSRREETILVPVKMAPELRKRFRVAAVERDMTYAQLIEHLLDEEARRVERRRARQAHPFHRPAPEAVPT